MSCNHINELIIDLLTNQLDAQGRQQLDSHLRTCQKCRAKLNQYENMWRKIDLIPQPQHSNNVLDGLKQRVKEEFDVQLFTDYENNEVQPNTGTWTKPFKLIAASILLLFLGSSMTYFYMNDSGSLNSENYAGDAMSEYIFILTRTGFDPTKAEQIEADMEKWLSQKTSQGIVIDSMWLPDNPTVDTPPQGSLLNEPILGFIVVKAQNDRDARQLAIEVPIVDYGGFLEVVKIDNE